MSSGRSTRASSTWNSSFLPTAPLPRSPRSRGSTCTGPTTASVRGPTWPLQKARSLAYNIPKPQDGQPPVPDKDSLQVLVVVSRPAKLDPVIYNDVLAEIERTVGTLSWCHQLLDTPTASDLHATTCAPTVHLTFSTSWGTAASTPKKAWPAWPLSTPVARPSGFPTGRWRSSLHETDRLHVP